MGAHLREKGKLVALFALALIPRAASLSAFVTADEAKWVNRAVNFLQALLNFNFAYTFQAGHPGVTTMWMGALGLMAEYLRRGAQTGLADFLGSVPTRRLELKLLPMVRFPIALLTALCVIGIYLLSKELFGKRAALIGGVILALDPLYLAHSRLIHLDAIVSSFMSISVLSMAAYIRSGRTRHIIISGVSAGLAILTKATGAFLVPFIALAIHLARRKGIRLGWGDLAKWGVMCILTIFLLWPALWVDLKEASGKVVREMLTHATLTQERKWMIPYPGPLFYPLDWLFRVTPPALIGITMAVVLARRAKERNTVSMLSIYIFLFTAFLTASFKKGGRYLLPIYPIVDVIAGFGLYELTQRFKGKVGSLTIISVLIIQAALSLSHHPYYLTYFNPLVGGGHLAPNVIKVGWGEGLELAAHYLNAKDDAADLKVVSWYNSVFASFFKGKTIGLIHSPAPALEGDYVVFYVNQVQRNLPDPELVRSFRDTEPEYVVRLKGIDYAWVYRGSIYGYRVPRMQYSLEKEFGSKALLLGCDIEGPSKEVLRVTLFWKCLMEMGKDYEVEVRLVDEEGRIWAQAQGRPAAGLLPTTDWRVGMVIKDKHELRLRREMPSGEYQLIVELLDLATGNPLGSASLKPVEVFR